jgi:YidC/Oxa1 family membrane protein insertase
MSTLNNPRVYLWAALAALLFLDYQSWVRDYSGPGAAGAVTAAAGGHAAAPPGADLSTQVPQAPAAHAGASPGAESSGAAASGAPSSGAASTATSGETAAAVAGAGAAAAAALVHVRTDVLALDISTRGGTLVQADLLAYPLVKGQPTPVRLENDDSPETLYELESGLAGPGGASYPTHLATFESARSDYEMGRAAELRVPFTWRGDNGVTVTKTYVFHRGSYRIDLDYQVQNGSGSPWRAHSYAQILRNNPPTKRSYFNVESYSFHGPAMWAGKYTTLNTADAENNHLSIDVRDGWIAALQHHFVSAIVPPRDSACRFTLNVQGNEYLFAATGPDRTITPGASGSFRDTLFVGPKLQNQLEAISPELDRVTDYGRLWFLARPLFLALSYVHKLTGNWGVAIIVVTFLLKLLFYPLSEASGRSMAKMKTLGPRIKNLQETYADDREKLGRAMMELYKREKVNPVAGCLPMIIQIPVFIAFYWVLIESVEMRQAPFALWIHDLSSRDPYFILPAIMAVAMFVQYKLNPAPPDPVQAKMFMIMPIVMSATFAFFPAGLVLYWVTNTILSIAQQWNINRRIAAAMAAKKN